MHLKELIKKSLRKKITKVTRSVSKKNILIVSLLMVTFIWFIYVVTRVPSNQRNWQDEVAVWPSIEMSQGVFTISNLRDWRYTDSAIVSKEYISRQYQISDLKQVWFLVEPFGGWDGIAHTFFSFEFNSAPPLVFSIEARMEQHEKYSALKGLFNQFELFYSWGTEEDLLVRRTLYLGNDVYMFPLLISDEGAKALLRTTLEETIDLQQNPRFYNTLSSNCTNNLARQGNLIKPGLIPRFHYARYMTGYADELLYNLGLIPNDLPIEAIQEKYRITDVVNEKRFNHSFSEEIRSSLRD